MALQNGGLTFSAWRVATARAAVCSLLVGCSEARAEIFSESLQADAWNIEAVVLDWDSRNYNVASLGSHIRNLIHALHNVGQLPLKPIDKGGESGIAAEQIVRRTVPFLEWSAAMDNILCDLNSDQCVRPRVPAAHESDSFRFAQLANHVSGYRITQASQSRWTLRPDRPLWVPDLEFQSFTRWLSAPIDSGVRLDLQQLYQDRALGCDEMSEPQQSFHFTGTIQEFRETRLASASCVAEILRNNIAFWTSLYSQKRMAAGDALPNRVSEQIHVRDFLKTKANEILDHAQESIAWEKLNSVVSEIYEGVDRPFREVSLPVFSLAATINLVSHPQYGQQDSASLTGDPNWLRFISSLTTLEAGNVLSEYTTVTPRLEGIVKPRSGSPDFHSSTVTPHESAIAQLQATNVFDVINFPYRNHDFLGDNGFDRSIIIVDSGLNKEHCVFSGNCNAKWLSHEIMTAANLNPIEEALVAKVKFELERMEGQGVGHGHGVAAVASANPQSGALFGLDPNAVPELFELNLTNWPTDNFEKRARDFIKGLTGHYVVWNFSGHTMSADLVAPIENYLRSSLENIQNTQLMVFAAGNLPDNVVDAHRVASDLCLVYPACRSEDRKLKSAVTVVGAMLNNEGVVVPWRDEAKGVRSYTHPSFEIAAVAKDVIIPSVSEEAFYSVEGTSYAAPQVSAVLLLLRSQMGIFPPEVFVGRIVGCGKMSTGLEGHVMGGLLDAECSLRFDRMQIAFRPVEGQEVDPALARRLRPGKLLGVWTGDGKPSETIPIDGFGGEHHTSWWPEVGRRSIVGFRQFSDKPDRYNLTVWNDKGVLSSEARGRLNSSLVLEFRFDGDESSICIEASRLIGYVPGAPLYVNVDDRIEAHESACVDHSDS
ncbi:S8 family serine peptidase [Paracoccus sp. MC1854]|uniref:S8 family serine peptidase n=1 Tax=Paracoccus sp. MC1854 TaxID=2760306 RepID=UPI0015FF2A49|nr:S8 family serine peptidase [Paracoccus sp. MC1854]MBB1492708.1 S8 family serine peptidase [Paracoccus sp. MC1854]